MDNINNNNNNNSSSSSSSDDEQDIKPNFRIRFTIRNSSSSPTPIEVSTECSCKGSFCDQHRKATRRCNHQIDLGNRINTTKGEQIKRKAFQIIEPQNHKSSLFVNLSDTKNDLQQKICERSLFVSPDLNQLAPTDSVDSTIRSSVSQTSNSLLSSEEDLSITADSSNMSQGCNLINSLMLASRCPSRCRSASATPASSNEPAAEDPDGSNNRRASSSNNLNSSESTNMDKTSIGDNPAINASNETLCDQTQKNSSRVDDYVAHSEMIQPLQLLINEPIGEFNLPRHSIPMNIDHPISLDDILQIDMDNSRLEDECKNLQNQVDLWEQKVEELEKQRFDKDVPRTLIENVLHQRKKLRELEFQIYTLNLKSEDAERHKERTLPSPDRSPNMYISHREHRNKQDNNLYPPLEEARKSTRFLGQSPMGSNKLTAGRVGSHLRPGQENTADILDAIPPSGSLQYRQYLSRASSGTDSSGYSHIPHYDRYRHIGHSHALPPSSDESNSILMSNWKGNTHQQQQNAQLASDRVEVIESPIRPNHFKPIFRSNRDLASQDSSSTTSSGSPY